VEESRTGKEEGEHEEAEVRDLGRTE